MFTNTSSSSSSCWEDDLLWSAVDTDLESTDNLIDWKRRGEIDEDETHVDEVNQILCL
jgi:hypothetical protein